MFEISKNEELVKVASRNIETENILCEAIKLRRIVSFRYKYDLRSREFAPFAVYQSPVGKICVSGEIIKNPNDLTNRLGPYNFEIGLMYGLSLTPEIFVPNPRFNRNDAKYRSGVICSV